MTIARAAYRGISLALAVVFAAVGLAFLLFPDATLALFDSLGSGSGDSRFFVVLASAYMYLVTALAWGMYKRPGERIYPVLLCQAKWASSLLSFAFFLLHKPMLIYVANGLVDGGLGLVVLLMIPSRSPRSPLDER